jgi:hypothetical protein
VTRSHSLPGKSGTNTGTNTSPVLLELRLYAPPELDQPGAREGSQGLRASRSQLNWNSSGADVPIIVFVPTNDVPFGSKAGYGKVVVARYAFYSIAEECHQAHTGDSDVLLDRNGNPE